MEIYVVIAVIFLVALLIPKSKKKNQSDQTKPAKVSEEKVTTLKISETPTESEPTLPETPEAATETELNISKAYQKHWMFTYNEKDAYHKLKAIADELGYTVFAKVRLLDIVEPRKGIEKYKTYFYKIQAKHVDFVLCDQKLVARYVIELDDGSHDDPKRQERDEFVDNVLTSVGYQIIHTRAITDDIKKQITPI